MCEHSSREVISQFWDVRSIGCMNSRCCLCNLYCCLGGEEYLKDALRPLLWTILSSEVLNQLAGHQASGCEAGSLLGCVRASSTCLRMSERTDLGFGLWWATVCLLGQLQRISNGPSPYLGLILALLGIRTIGGAFVHEGPDSLQHLASIYFYILIYFYCSKLIYLHVNLHVCAIFFSYFSLTQWYRIKPRQNKRKQVQKTKKKMKS